MTQQQLQAGGRASSGCVLLASDLLLHDEVIPMKWPLVPHGVQPLEMATKKSHRPMGELGNALDAPARGEHWWRRRTESELWRWRNA
jgi:hypothetical protein